MEGAHVRPMRPPLDPPLWPLSLLIRLTYGLEGRPRGQSTVYTQSTPGRIVVQGRRSKVNTYIDSLLADQIFYPEITAIDD